ncbi:MAG: OsmC family protein [Proteobacteria bacterium]|nr:MAG: OsmC family protein [Pseudomonadota bacterium]
MQASVRLLDGVSFEAVADSGHAVVIDGPPDFGGQNRGSRPMELILMGLGGCTAFDVVHILRKSRLEVSDCRVALTAERAETPPKVFTKIHVHFVVSGAGLTPEKVARAVELSAEKYCSASIMLGKAVEITHDFEIVEPGPDRD